MSDDVVEKAAHNPRARYCVVITTPPLPVSLLRDDACCPVCDDLIALIGLDPDTHPLSPHPCPIHWKDAS